MMPPLTEAQIFELAFHRSAILAPLETILRITRDEAIKYLISYSKMMELFEIVTESNVPFSIGRDGGQYYQGTIGNSPTMRCHLFSLVAIFYIYVTYYRKDY